MSRESTGALTRRGFVGLAGVAPIVAAGMTGPLAEPAAAQSTDAPLERQMAYAELTSSWNTSSTSAVEVPGLSFAVDVTDRPFLLEFDGLLQVYANKGLATIYVSVREGGTEVLRGVTSLPSLSIAPLQKGRFLAPAPGEHVYTTYIWVATAGQSAGLLASPTAPAYVRAVWI